MDLSIDSFPFSPYAEPMKIVIYTFFSISVLGIATGLILLISKDLKRWFISLQIAKPIAGVVLVSQWLLVATYALVLIVGTISCIYEAKYSDCVLLLIAIATFLVAPVCALLCWHHVYSCCKDHLLERQ